MPDYKRKKKHSIFSSSPKPKVENKKKDFNIKMYSDDEYNELKPPRVIKGKKITARVKRRSALTVIAVFLCVVGIAYLIFPAGIIETVSASFSSLGTGTYPLKINGTKILDLEEKGKGYYLSTDSSIYNFNNSGKMIDSFSHGYSQPVIRGTKTRLLVYGQGENSYFIRRGNENIIDEKTDYGILSGDISENGTYALATASDNFASSVSVCNKNGKQIFKWNCAKDLINSVALSDDGQKIAVSTVNSNVGKISSKVHIFSFKDSDAQNTFDYSEVAVYSLESFSDGFFAITDRGYDYYNWKGKNEETINTDFHISFFRTSKNGSVFVFNRESNKTDNTVHFVNSKGKKESEFSFKGNISDIRTMNSHIYIISESEISMFDKTGKKIFSAGCGFDQKFISVTGSQRVDALTDNVIESVRLK